MAQAASLQAQPAKKDGLSGRRASGQSLMEIGGGGGNGAGPNWAIADRSLAGVGGGVASGTGSPGSTAAGQSLVQTVESQ